MLDRGVLLGWRYGGLDCCFACCDEGSELRQLARSDCDRMMLWCSLDLVVYHQVAQCCVANETFSPHKRFPQSFQSWVPRPMSCFLSHLGEACEILQCKHCESAAQAFAALVQVSFAIAFMLLHIGKRGSSPLVAVNIKCQLLLSENILEYCYCDLSSFRLPVSCNAKLTVIARASRCTV